MEKIEELPIERERKFSSIKNTYYNAQIEEENLSKVESKPYY